LSRRHATRRFTYGYDRAEDIAGVLIVLIIVASAFVAGYESYLRLIHVEGPRHLEWAMGAALIGFMGNEAVALYRIKVGREIGSAALVADGQHARIDGLTSLAALAGLLGVSRGYPMADPLAGLLITVAIFFIAYKAGREILARLMDAIDPQMVEDIERVALEVQGVRLVHDIRARWVGHQIYMEIHISVDGHLSVIEGHRRAEEVCHELLHHIPRLSGIVVHVDPVEKIGESYHGLTAHHFRGASPPEVS
jgi:cation diffusion facilitator family transporter